MCENVTPDGGRIHWVYWLKANSVVEQVHYMHNYILNHKTLEFVQFWIIVAITLTSHNGPNHVENGRIEEQLCLEWLTRGFCQLAAQFSHFFHNNKLN